jgi:hypothetical protein
MISALNDDVMGWWKPVEDEVMDLSKPGSTVASSDVEDGTADSVGIVSTEPPGQQCW